MTEEYDVPDTLVRDLIARLRAAGVDAEWTNTGGGCMAVAVWRDATHTDYRILVTDRDDVFAGGDLDSDTWVGGFFVQAYDDAEEPIEPELYRSPEPRYDDGGLLTSRDEPRHAADAILDYLSRPGAPE